MVFVDRALRRMKIAVHAGEKAKETHMEQFAELLGLNPARLIFVSKPVGLPFFGNLTRTHM